MTDELKQTIKNGVEKLPKEIQGVFNDFDWLKISEEIGKKYLLDENEINILQNEIGLVLIEDKDKEILSLNIENNVGTSKNEAVKIAEEIEQKIFKPMIKKIELSVKNNMSSKNPSWKQRVNFIVSGGNYSAFMEETENKNTPKPKVEYREAI